jgi:ABC-type sugar transport system ATPase subunit
MLDVAIETKNLCVNFGKTKALVDCNFFAHRGKITAILGDNGSGKTTLMKALTGNIKPNSGTIIIQDNIYNKLTLNQSINMGMHCVYQDLSLDEYKSSAENIFLGNEILKKGIFIDKKEMEYKAKELLQKLNINIPNISTPVKYLSGGQKQGVAIAKALNKNANILILDEPTSAMGVKESKKVMEMLKDFSNKNNELTQIIITHNIFWAFEIADEIAVMHLGKCIAHFETKTSSPQQIHEFILRGGEGNIND